MPFGQPGAGKSSLINELIGEKKAKVGTGTDTTKEAQVIESGSVVYVDLPGYDTARFPKKGYFSHFDPLQYDLFLCIFRASLRRLIQNFFPVSSGWAGSAFLCAIRSMGFMLLFGP